MKTLVCFFFYWIIIFTCNAQINYGTLKKGGYLTYNEFTSNKPSFTCNFKVKKRTKFAIYTFGGNEYKITSDSIKHRLIKKDIWGFYDGKDFYINCKNISKHRYYAKFESASDNEIYFFAIYDKSLNQILLETATINMPGGGISAPVWVKYIFYKRSGGVFQTDIPR